MTKPNDRQLDPAQHLQAAQDIVDRAQATMSSLMETIARLARDIHDANTHLRLATALQASSDVPALSARRPGASTKPHPFTRQLTATAALELATAVSQSGRSQQPVKILAWIYESYSHPRTTPNSIADSMRMAHSTVDRAIRSAIALHGSSVVGPTDDTNA
ncbi:hypothetical protein AB0L97_37870 [Nocardia sp. NPDC051911]|uniref:hypothetical protein n=1 Tax=Nocardia sp. NPDC051911 TaxID=3154648 RepID=UPI003432102A